MTKLDDLHDALSGMLASISSPGGAQNGEHGALGEYLRRIDGLKDELGDEAPPMLAHYLEKRSYTKALDFLEGRDETAAPNC